MMYLLTIPAVSKKFPIAVLAAIGIATAVLGRDVHAVEVHLGGNLYTAPYGPGNTYNLYEVWGVPDFGSIEPWYDAHLDANSRVDPLRGTLTGHLASIHSQAENDFVHQIGGIERVWIGLTDNELFGGTEAHTNPNGGWVWTSGEPYTFQNWNTVEPNNSSPGGGVDSPPGEDAVHLRASSGTGRWNDEKSNIPGSDQIGAGNIYVVEYEFNTVNPVPEPSTFILCILGLIWLGFCGKRRKGKLGK